MRSNFISWYLAEYPILLAFIFQRHLQYFWHYFSFKVLFPTLFSPWKRNDAFYLGIKPNAVFEVIITNFFSRLIGFFVRTFVLLIGTIIILLSIIFLVLTLLIIYCLPFFGYFWYLNMPKTLNFSEIKSWDKIVLYLTKSYFWHHFHNLTLISPNKSLELLEASHPDLSDLENKIKDIPLHLQAFQIILYLFETNSEFEKLCFENHIDKTAINQIGQWSEYLHNFYQKYDWKNPDFINSQPQIGAQWHYGFTPFLNQFSHEVPAFSFKDYALVNRTYELEQLKQILNRTDQPFAIVYGQPGVGRKSLVNGLIHQSQWNHSQGFDQDRFMFLDIDQFKEAQADHDLNYSLEQLIKESFQAGNVVLVIKDMAQFLKGSPSRDFDPIKVLSQTLTDNPVPIIGLATTDEYKNEISTNPAIHKFFTPLELTELSFDDVMLIGFLKTQSQNLSRLKIPYQSLLKIYELTKMYLPSDVFPEKLIDVLEIAATKFSPNYTVTPDDITQIISNSSGVKIGSNNSNDLEMLKILESSLNQIILDQKDAIAALATSIRRNQTIHADSNHPIGGFLFLGPTGVGKTATAKVLTQLFFESRQMIRFDMAQYNSSSGLEKLIGTKTQLGDLAEKIINNPNTVLLLDEFEKAPRNIHNLFLTILDEGYFYSGKNIRIDCANLIIIATSNALSHQLQKLNQSIANKEEFQTQMINLLIEKDIFSAELLNRFDQVIFYSDLTEVSIKQIIRTKLANLANEIKDKKHIDLYFSPEFIEEVYTKGYSDTFGVRSVEHYISNQVEDQIAQKILTDPDVREIHL